MLGLDFAGDVSGQYGALSVSKLTTLDGGLAIDLTGGFTLATNDSFDILGFGSHMGDFDTLTLDGAACSSTVADMWTCGGGVRLKEVIDPTSLDLFVARGSFVSGPVGSSPIPEPSTWAMLALGFLGLGGFGLKARRRAAPGRPPRLDKDEGSLRQFVEQRLGPPQVESLEPLREPAVDR